MRRHSTSIVVFCRQPRPGVGKQRLAADIGKEAAARVANALWDCVVEDLRDWSGDLALAVAGAEEASWGEEQVRSLRQTWSQANKIGAARVLVQPTGNLGERIQGIDVTLRALGYQRLVYIGSDAPGLSGPRLDAIDAILQHADVALAPADDGGVVAMAARLPWPPLADLPWSSHLLGHALRARCESAGQGVSMALGSMDVDDLSGLRAACAALRGDSRPARRALLALAAVLPAAGRP